MLHATSTVKGAWPAFVAGGSFLLALDATAISVAVIAAANAVVVGYLGFRSEANRQRTTRLAQEQTKADQLIDQLQEQLSSEMTFRSADRQHIAELERDHRRLYFRVIALESGALRLISQLQELGHEPIWTPEPPNPPSPEGVKR